MITFTILSLLLSSILRNRFYEAIDNDLVERAFILSSNTLGPPKIRPNEKIIEKVKNDYYQIWFFFNLVVNRIRGF